MLQRLLQPCSIALSVHAHPGASIEEWLDEWEPSSLNDAEWEWLNEWEPLVWAPPPPLAALTALTSLALHGTAGLPPDWHRLRHLKRLAVFHDKLYAEGNDEEEGFSWDEAAGNEINSLDALRCLTRLELSWGAILPGEGQGRAGLKQCTLQGT